MWREKWHTHFGPTADMNRRRQSLADLLLSNFQTGTYFFTSTIVIYDRDKHGDTNARMKSIAVGIGEETLPGRRKTIRNEQCIMNEIITDVSKSQKSLRKSAH